MCISIQTRSSPPGSGAGHLGQVLHGHPDQVLATPGQVLATPGQVLAGHPRPGAGHPGSGASWPPRARC